MSESLNTKLEIGEILSAGFKPLKAHWRPLLFRVGVPYLLTSLVLVGAMGWLLFSALSPVLGEVLTGNMSDVTKLYPVFAAYAGLIIVALVPASLASAALFRFHTGAGLKGAFFAFRFGADEVRQYVALLLVMFVAILLPTALLVSAIIMVLKISSYGAIVALVLGIFFLLPVCMAYFGVRLSLAFALTFTQKRLRVFTSWRQTRGHFWVLFLTFAVLYILFGLVSMLITTPANVLFYAQQSTGWLGDPEMLENLDPDDLPILLRETFLSTRTIIAFAWVIFAGTLLNVLQAAAFNGASLFALQEIKNASAELAKEIA